MRRWGLVSDIHFDERFLPRVVDAGRWVCDAFAQQRVTHIFVLGDVLNTRDSVAVSSLSAAMSWFRDLREVAPTSVIAGNHDMHLRHSAAITSLDALEYLPQANGAVGSTASIKLYRNSATAIVDEAPCAFFPYSMDTQPLKQFSSTIQNPLRQQTVAFAHAEVPGAKMSRVLLPNSSSASHLAYGHKLCEPKSAPPAASSFFLDGFRWSFSGHFHLHQTLRGNVTYVGAPLQHHFGDAGDPRGVLIYDYDANSFERILNPQWDVFRHTVIQSEADLLHASGNREFDGKHVLAYLATFDVSRNAVIRTMQQSGALSVRAQALWIPKVSSPVHAPATSQIPDVPLRRDQWFLSSLPLYLDSLSPALETAARESLLQAGERIFDALFTSSAKPQKQTAAFTASIARLEIENFMSVRGVQTLDLTVGTNAVWMISGANGSGKSLLLEAVTWCLFGRVLRSDMLAADVVNDRAPRDALCSVTVNFDHGISIKRVRSVNGKSSVRVFKNGVELEEYAKGTMTAADAAIATNLLGVDFDMFTRCVVVSDTVLASFVAGGSQKERLAFMERVLGLDELDDVLEMARQLLSKIVKRIQELEAKKNQLMTKCDTLVRQTDLMKAKLRNLQVQIASVELEQVRLEREREEASARVREVEEESHAEFESLASVPARTMPSTNAPHHEGDTCMGSTAVLADVYTRGVLPSFQSFARVWQQFDASASVHVASAEHRRTVWHHIHALQGPLSSLLTTLHASQEVSAGLTFEQERRSSEELLEAAVLQSAQQHQRAVMQRRQERADRVMKLTNVVQACGQAQASLVHFKRAVAETEAEMDSTSFDLKHSAEQLEAVNSDLLPLSKEKSSYEFWEAVLGRGRKVKNSASSSKQIPSFRAFLLGCTVDDLNKMLKEYSAQLFENGTMDLEIQLDASLSIISEYGKRSTGQRKRFDLCVLFALFEVLRQNSAFKPSFLMLDEIFDSLDSDGQRNILQMLQDLSQRFGSIYVVSHADTFKQISGRNTHRIDVSFSPESGTVFTAG
jgi:Fe-S cluster assembly ATPase SufC/DNA repair exonuclease SbcCD nuclease subunit